jgi:tripartite-type tricarboxylate transporter receptor subunit TctC
MLHVPYKGSAQAIVDLVAGRAEVMFIHVPVVLQHIQSGRLRALGVTGPRRNALVPDVPAIGEALIKGYEITGWEGIYAPAGTPREIIAKVNEAAASVLGTPESKEAWAAKAVEFHPNTPEQFAAKTRADYEKTAALIRAAGIKSER